MRNDGHLNYYYALLLCSFVRSLFAALSHSLSLSFFFICSTNNFFTVNIFFPVRNLSHEFNTWKSVSFRCVLRAHGQRSHSLTFHTKWFFSAGKYFDWQKKYIHRLRNPNPYIVHFIVLNCRNRRSYIYEQKGDRKYRPLRFIWTRRKKERKRIKFRHPIGFASIYDGSMNANHIFQLVGRFLSSTFGLAENSIFSRNFFNRFRRS